MAVHMFRCFIGRGKMSLSDLETRINDWVTSNAEWTDDTTPHTVTERNTQLDGTGETYYRIDVRIELVDAKDNLMQKFQDKLVNKVAWYRVGYHECDHDEQTAKGCEWQDAVDWTDKDVTIPSGVPGFEVPT